MQTSAPRFMTCEWNHALPGSTYAYSQKVNLHTISNAQKWQCAYLMDCTSPMHQKICSYLHRTANESSTIIALLITLYLSTSHLSNPISWEEFNKAVRILKNAKAAGLTRVPPNAFKAMTACNLQHVYKHVNNFFLGTAD
jgi:hypothetical protein